MSGLRNYDDTFWQEKNYSKHGNLSILSIVAVSTVYKSTQP